MGLATKPLIHAEGIRALRKDLRAIDRKFPRELNKGLWEAVRPIVRDAASLAPRKTGALAGSLRPFASGSSVGVRSRLPYANVIHWGGTTGPGHQYGPWKGSVYLPRRSFTLADGRSIEAHQPFIWQAAARNTDAIVDALGDAVEDLARRHGW